jgi:hypothetical protein
VQVTETAAATSTLTIATNRTTAALLPSELRVSGIAFAALLLFFLAPRRRNALFVILFSFVALAGATGCGSGNSSGGSTRISTTPGTYSVVVTATSSSLSVNTTISLIVQ